MTELDDRQAFLESLITHLLFVFADESANQNGSLSGRKDASVHIVFALFNRELSPNMHRLHGIIQPFEVSYG